MKKPAPAKPTLTLVLPQRAMKLSHLLSPQRRHEVRGRTAQWQCAATSSITWQINSPWWRLRGRICCFPSAHWFSNGESWLMKEQGCLLGNNRGRPFMGATWGRVVAGSSKWFPVVSDEAHMKWQASEVIKLRLRMHGEGISLMHLLWTHQQGKTFPLLVYHLD